MTDAELAEIRQRCEAAMTGPWYVVGPPWGDGSYVVAGHEDPHVGRYVCGVDEMAEDVHRETHGKRDWVLDIEFIAHAREDVSRLLAEIERLRAAIRKHRDYRGDDRCHLDDGELYAVLPEGDTRSERDTAVTLENCQRFMECRQQGREYISPEREIERLRACRKALADIVKGVLPLLEESA